MRRNSGHEISNLRTIFSGSAVGGERPLAEIAALCGFTSLSQFSRMFKREAGVCPSTFRDRK